MSVVSARLRVCAPFDDGNVGTCQRQVAREHHPRRASSGDHHRMLGHSQTPVVLADVTNS
jgi:hypothetical protein